MACTKIPSNLINNSFRRIYSLSTKLKQYPIMYRKRSASESAPLHPLVLARRLIRMHYSDCSNHHKVDLFQ